MVNIVGAQLNGTLSVDDDAFYYLIIAKNIAASGVSTFDHLSLTNGYHPLWLGVLVLQDLTVGPSIFVTLSLSALFLCGGLYLFLRLVAAAPGILQAALTFCFILLFERFGLAGMEVALLVFCVGLFVTALDWAMAGGPRRGLVLGLAAAACVGARIDSAFFIAPALIAAPISRQGRGLAFAVLGGLGAIYAACNLAVFGVAMPISSTIKSLGGLQLNHRLLAQLGLGHDIQQRRSLFFMLTTALLLVSPVLVILSKPKTIARALAVATSVGGWIFLAKLVFLSSWVIWAWYNFAILFPLISVFYVVVPASTAWVAQLEARAGAFGARAVTLAFAITGFGVIAGAAATSLAVPAAGRFTFASINHLAIQRYAKTLGGAPVAMGDRAGSFAMEYTGGVVQLEGLVNDKAYLKVLTQRGDVRKLLCGRGVRFVVAYDRDLGAYDHLRFGVFRPALTQFNGPNLDVWRADEVGHVEDTRLFDNRANAGIGDNTLYIWRLRCA